MVMSPAILIRLYTLALCLWREARGETILGKVLVAQVIENRVKDTRWPDDYVSVITQPWQFSAFNPNDPNVVKFPKEDDPTWPDCVAAATIVLEAPSPLTRANHYHAKSVNPTWANTDKIVMREGNHIFYNL